MVGAEKVILAGTGAAVLSAIAIVEGIPKPESFWPVTITGWVALLSGVSGLVVSGYLLYKRALSPVVVQLAELKQHMTEMAKGERDYFSVEIHNAELRIDQKFNAFTQRQEANMNAFGGRIDATTRDMRGVEDDMRAQGIVIDGVVKALERSIADREHLNRSVDAIRIEMNRDRERREDFERKVLERLPRNAH